MGILDIFRSAPPTIFTPRETAVTTWDEWAQNITADLTNTSPAALFEQQPHLRTVVSFLARNIAQLGVHTYQRVGETDRRRDRSSAVTRALASVDGQMTTYDLMYALVGDLMLYDRAYWWVAPSSEVASGWMIRRIPPTWVTVRSSNPFTVDAYRVSYGKTFVDVPPSQILPFTGYSPTSALYGSPTVESLRGTLQEQIEAATYRAQVWKRGGRVSSVLQRPKDAPTWSDAARESFRADWYAKFTGRGSKAGGTPILEDGMTLNRIDFNAQEQQYVEAAKLSLTTVASAFHVNPTMIGQNEGASYSNVREFRKMLYGDTLGPTIAQIEARLNTFLLPMLGVDNASYYLEFNILEKLQGNFEEQADAIQTATGAPWMTRAEARARMNLPSVPDSDGLVVPLNVLIGGQASPSDSAPKSSAVRFKVRAAHTYEQKYAEVVGKFFARQRRVVKTALGVKDAGEWWDSERWDTELSGDLYRLALAVTKQVSAKTLDEIGFDPEEYDVDRTLAWLDEVSSRSAASINETTKTQIAAALSADDPATAVKSVFDIAEGQRSGAVAAGAVTMLSAWATVEATRQAAGDKASKTWVTGGNPRDSHAKMNGETVALSENFSNGMAWPGDSSIGDADELAGCNCSVDIEIA